MKDNRWNEMAKVEADLKRHKEPEPEMGLDDMFFEKMHDQIMAKIEEKPIPKKRRKVIPVGLPRWWIENRARIAKGSSAGLMLSMLLLQALTPAAESLATQELLQRSEAQPQLVAQSTLVQNQNDFLVDVASESLNHLDEEQIKALISDL